MKILIILLLIFVSETFSLKANERLKRKRDSEHQHPIKHWGYRNQDRSLLPKNWHKSHPQCYGQQQSPINVERDLTIYDKNLHALEIIEKIHDENSTEEWEVKNNGHSVVMYSKTRNYFFKSEGSEYKFLQMHFHWRGSEHYVNGHRYAGELHLVHQSTQDENKFAVIGFLLGQTNHDNKNLLPVTNVLKNIIKYNSKELISDFSLNSLIPFDLKNYFRYSGSLTTPGCDEVVQWHLVDSPILEISDEQILEFQSLEDSHGFVILTNSRPIQELNDRNVRRSFNLEKLEKMAQEKTQVSEPANSSVTTSASFLLLTILLIINKSIVEFF
ncbi:unnamed protein product [Brachionus calyciflorus]|uniref:Carbonic anhydrase n=1 Tax=Brachionus calyciflorus TaxID=104777 RepID=A0A813WQG6_9BILA|nr:unnamed protein product [Brachionus calyciflorus]